MNRRIYQIAALMSFAFVAVVYSQHNHSSGQMLAPAHNHNIEKGKVLYGLCVTCHGKNGEGNKELKAPRIGGQYEWYIRSQLSNFKFGKRGLHPDDVEGALMVPFAKGLQAEQEVHDVAAYVSTLKPNISPPSIQGDIIEGKFMFGNCAVCHDNMGKGIAAYNSPAIILLNDWYIKSQLLKFKKGIRGHHTDTLPAKQMQAMTDMLEDEQAIDDMVAYLNAVVKAATK